MKGNTQELAMIDEFELKSYSLKDFKLRSLGKDSALVTYTAHYEGKAAATAYGEVRITNSQGYDWKHLHVQENER